MTTNNTVELPSGKSAERQELKGSDYFQFQSLAAKASSDPNALGDASRWLILRAYKIDGKPLTVDVLDDMPFQDVAALQGDVTDVFLQPQAQES